MGRVYNGIILTDHALARMRERGIDKELVFSTLSHPDRSRYSKEKSSFIYNKTYGQNMIEVVAAKNERNQWVVVSVWSRPLERLQYTSKKYYVHVGIIDRLLDWIESLVTKRKR